MKGPDGKRDEARDASLKRPEEAIEDLEPDERASEDVKGGDFTISKKVDIASSKLFLG
jgi:hypothetical protein